jgi:hypothetical protein
MNIIIIFGIIVIVSFFGLGFTITKRKRGEEIIVISRMRLVRNILLAMSGMVAFGLSCYTYFFVESGWGGLYWAGITGIAIIIFVLFASITALFEIIRCFQKRG